VSFRKAYRPTHGNWGHATRYVKIVDMSMMNGIRRAAGPHSPKIQSVRVSRRVATLYFMLDVTQEEADRIVGYICTNLAFQVDS
jgi:hypothetical protein